MRSGSVAMADDLPSQPSRHEKAVGLRYGAALALVALALAARAALDTFLGNAHPFPMFLAATVLAAWYGGIGPALVALICGYLVANWFFMPPRHNFADFDSLHLFSLATYTTTGLVMSLAVNSAQTAARRARHRATQLEQERERFRITLSSIGDAVIATDVHGRVMFMNSVAEQLTGYTQQEMYEQPLQTCFKIHNELTGKPVDNPVIKVLQQGIIVGLANHTVLISKSGREIPIDDSAAPIRGPSGDMTGTVLVFRDVSPQRAAELGVRRLAAIVDNSDDAIVGKNLNGVVTSWNKGAERIFGYSAAEMVGQSITILIPSERQDEEEVILERLQRGERVDHFETVRQTKAGQRIHVSLSISPIKDAEGRLMGASKIARDITERKRAEEALRESEERHRRSARHALLRAEVAAQLAQQGATAQHTLQLCTESIVRHLGAAFARIWTLNPQSQTLELQASAGMYTHLDGPHARVPVGKFKIGLIAQEAKPHLTNDVQHDPRISNPEWAHREGMVAFAGYPLLADGRVLGVMALFAKHPLPDDTLDAISSVADLVAQGVERKRAEQALQNARDELRRHADELERRVNQRTASLQQSLKSMETVLYTIAHDLRSPNRAMQGFAQLLAQEYGSQLNETARSYLNRISDAAVKNDTLICDLLEYGRLAHAELPMDKIDLGQSVQKVINDLRPQITSKNAIIEAARDMPCVWANDSVLSQIITNLLTNAVKFVSDDVPPHIRVWADPSNNDSASSVKLFVQDNGIGIPPEVHPRLFQPFERGVVDRSYEGTGMGLAIVQKGAERLGGKVGFQSTPGKGSIFWIELLSTNVVEQPRSNEPKDPAARR